MNIKNIIFVIAFATLFVQCKKEPDTSTVIVYDHIPTYNDNGQLNMLVEIPAGTTAKYELDKKSLTLKIDSINGEPRYINYLGYPGNYGMIPGTMLDKELGGDGDPLDIILLGPSLERGTIQACKIIGVLKLMDNNEQDDKLVAVPFHKSWAMVNNIDDLNLTYNGVTSIIQTFFSNYKGPNKMIFEGWGNKEEAEKILTSSIIKP